METKWLACTMGMVISARKDGKSVRNYLDPLTVV